MSKRTYAEIINGIRLKCARAYWSLDSLHPNGDIPEIKCIEPHKLATQLESAHKREVDALNQRLAELSADIAAKDEVIKRLNDAIAEEQKCSELHGNMAKLREALSKFCAYSAVVLNTGMLNRVNLEALLNMAKAALAATSNQNTQEEN